MSFEANKVLVHRQFEEVWNKGNLEVINEIYASTLTNQGIPQANGPEHIKYVVQLWLTAFPDIHYTIDRIIAEDEYVAALVTANGSHTGVFRHPRGTYEPTGQNFKVRQMHLFQIVEGKIVEHQGVRDDFEMFRQLGLFAEVVAQQSQASRNPLP